ncbi:unnamed protein product [Trifolium pratense]|uniref:Uncharacterized protein n=1 Tax=Trifolium pratense TaxID=57577 RepID=A0ACB0MDQ5_TRIPR|nr:unnamed protein product [Trifolium pratense]
MNATKELKTISQYWYICPLKFDTEYVIQRIGVCQSIVTASIEDPNGYKFEKNDLRTLCKVMLQLKILKVISLKTPRFYKLNKECSFFNII